MKKKSFVYVLLRKFVEKSFCFGCVGLIVEVIIGGWLFLNLLFVLLKFVIVIGCEFELVKYDW